MHDGHGKYWNKSLWVDFYLKLQKLPKYSSHSLDLYFIFNSIFTIEYKQDFDVSAKYTQKCIRCKHRTYIVCYLSAYVRINYAT